MNLRTIYEIFYPGKSTQYPFAWKEIPKYRSKKEFMKRYSQWSFVGSI